MRYVKSVQVLHGPLIKEPRDFPKFKKKKKTATDSKPARANVLLVDDLPETKRPDPLQSEYVTDLGNTGPEMDRKSLLMVFSFNMQSGLIQHASF